MPKKFNEILPVKLTRTELLEIGKKAGVLANEIEELVEVEKERAKDAKGEIQLRRDEQHALLDQLRTGHQERAVEVEWQIDVPAKKARLIRADTGQEVRTRPLTDEDLQTTMTA